MKMGAPDPFQAAGMETDWNVRAVREGIWKGIVSFPSQAPIFPRLQRPDVQWRMALLYFVRRWGAVQIAKRYGVTRQRVLQMLRQWTARAIVCGYVGRIPPEQIC